MAYYGLTRQEYGAMTFERLAALTRVMNQGRDR